MKKQFVKASIVTTGNMPAAASSKIFIEGMAAPPFEYNLLADAYSYNGYHTKCINLKAALTVGAGFEIFPGNPDDYDENLFSDEKEKIESFLYQHQIQTGQSFIETLLNFQTDYEIYGNAYFEICRNKKGIPSAIYHLPANSIKVLYKNKLTYIAQTANLDEIIFSPFGVMEPDKNEYLSMKSYNPQNLFYGLPEYFGALSAIILDRNAVEFNINKFNNNAIPESIIVIKGASLSDLAKTRIKQFFADNVKGVKNAGKSLILEMENTNGTIDIKNIAETVPDSSFRNMRLDARDEIIAAHGVPKRLLGIVEGGNIAGTNETRNQLKIFQDCVIEARQRRLEFLLNNRLLMEGLKIKNCKILFNRPYAENPQQDANFYKTMIENGVLTPEEVKAELGYTIN